MITPKQFILDKYNRAKPIAKSIIDKSHPELNLKLHELIERLDKKLNRFNDERYKILLVSDTNKTVPEMIENFVNILLGLVLKPSDIEREIVTIHKKHKSLNFTTKDGDCQSFKLKK